MFLGGLAMAKEIGFQKKQYTILVSMLIFGVALIASGIVPTHMFWLFVILTFIMGIMEPFFEGLYNVILQTKISPDKQGRADQLEPETPGHKRSFNQIPALGNADVDIRLIGDNTPDKALEDFEKIKKKAEKITRTKIETTVISKGTPVKTNKKLNEKIAEVCEKEDICYMEMPSYPGQDTGYIPTKKKTMIFIPSNNISHNPAEQTWPKYINPATRIFVAMAQELLKEKFKDKYAVKSEGKTGKGNKKDKNKEKIKLEKDNSMVI